MLKKTIFLFLLILLTSAAVFAQRGTARGETVEIRFASSLPRNSDWGRALDRLAADWERVTNNSVRVVISHDGREGGEAQMLSSLSSNSIQVAIFTTHGISEICPPVMTLSAPFIIKNDAEFDIVFNELRPVLENRVHNDFVIIAWSKGGWVYVFSKEKVFTPTDLRQQRMASGSEFQNLNLAFRTMGFQVVETDMVSLAPRLASGMVNAIYLIPAAIAPMQLHRHLGNMLNLPIAPIMGAIVMNRVTWNRLTPSHQQEILRASQRIADEFDRAMPRTESNAVASMGRSGLTVNRLTAAQEDLWRKELEEALPSLVGPVFDRDIFQRMIAILERARSRR